MHIGLVGYIILISSTNPSLSYFAVYLAASYVYLFPIYSLTYQLIVVCYSAIYPTIRMFVLFVERYEALII